MVKKTKSKCYRNNGERATGVKETSRGRKKIIDVSLIAVIIARLNFEPSVSKEAAMGRSEARDNMCVGLRDFCKRKATRMRQSGEATEHAEPPCGWSSKRFEALPSDIK